MPKLIFAAGLVVSAHSLATVMVTVTIAKGLGAAGENVSPEEVTGVFRFNSTVSEYVPSIGKVAPAKIGMHR